MLINLSCLFTCTSFCYDVFLKKDGSLCMNHALLELQEQKKYYAC